MPKRIMRIWNGYLHITITLDVNAFFRGHGWSRGYEPGTGNQHLVSCASGGLARLIYRCINTTHTLSGIEVLDCGKGAY